MCRIFKPLKIEDIRFANLVVVGHVEKYEIVGGEDRGRRYARFAVAVDEVLLGESGTLVTATWLNSTFALPEALSSEPLLIAFRGTRANVTPHQRPSGISYFNEEGGSLPVLQARCSSPFIMPSNSEVARAIRERLS